MNQDVRTAEIGVIGMAVMGSNLARNFASKGFRTAIYNRTSERTSEVAAAHPEAGFLAAETLAGFVGSLERPRRIVMMVKAGAATDATIDAVLPLLERGDILIDGGNSFFKDTQRRERALTAQGINFMGCGISGGEEGALLGPAMMPGGPKDSYPAVGPMLEAVSAHFNGEPCCAWIGPDGAGHFVKMVHNGIEYADMQLIGEAYELLRALGLDAAEAAAVFRSWNTGDLDSYLIEITAEVLSQVDADTGRPLVELIVDEAGMKGTGTWTVQEALSLGAPVPVIAESVFARGASSSTELRSHAREALAGPVPAESLAGADRDAAVARIADALWCAKVVAYSQGLDEIRVAGAEYGWDIDMGSCARIWRAGCIIRAQLLDRISNEYAAANLVTLLEAPSIRAELGERQQAWREAVGLATAAGVPVPCLSSALAHYDLIRAPRTNAALIQGQRDFFGAHTYRRIDRPGTFHTLWSGDRSEVEID
jgi:6-phosphogluconate dehydrogenase